MYKSHRSRANNTRGQKFDVNRNRLSLRSFATSLKKISLKSDFIQFLMTLYMYIASGQGQTGTKFLYQQKCLVTSFVCCKFKKMSLKSDFLQFLFSMI